MVNTSTHPVTVDGFRLDTLARNIEIRDGLNYAPKIQGENLQIAGMHGKKWIRNKLYDEARYVLSMWVSSYDDDGKPRVGYDGRQGLEESLDTLKSILIVRNRRLDVRVAYGGQIGTRKANCELTNAIEPQFVGWAPTTVKLSVELTNPDCFWEDVSAPADSVYTNTGGGATMNAVVNMTGLARATAPMGDLYYVFKGPANNPEIRDTATGHYCRYNGTLSASQWWRIEAKEMKFFIGTGGDGFTGGTRTVPGIVRGGAHLPAFMVLSPNQGRAGSPQLTVITTGGATVATSLTVRGKRKYL